ncbi:hypothetical protein AYL99_09066 [Fonsecaea erecta]|uniref:Uncharacterized protein n=1 Tax=Fonsecaea erecta TaxID=1367422 RepID=A0A178ZAZ6_9EURO|nr:hypothetical protein AYL99_09066 [Fonsecaea erecta]OAP56954.1 hypothetical protein AYL99_09066 [Fonsecaea erecta]
MPPRLSPSAVSLKTPNIHTHCKSCFQRSFSSTPSLSQTKLREQFWLWLRGPGENFRHPLPGSTNYLSAYDRRGNLIRRGRGQEASGESEKEKSSEDAVTADEEALEAAATEHEQEYKLPKETLEDLRPFPWNKNFGKPLAIPYARAVHGMVPLTTLNPTTRLPDEPHESINDLEQHPLTFPQIFYPASESRAFNRTDAGRVFSGAPRLSDEQENAIDEGAHEAWQDSRPEIIGRPGHTRTVLKPADSRIPHPHLIAFEKDKQDRSLTPLERRARHRERLEKDEERRRALKAKLQEEEESKRTRIDVGRWQFVVTEVQSTRQGTGLDGRGSGKGAVGQRYGVPSQERKKGQVKIPTKVDV